MTCSACSGKGYRVVGRLPDCSDDREEGCSTCAELGNVCDSCGEGIRGGDLCVSCCLAGPDVEHDELPAGVE